MQAILDVPDDVRFELATVEVPTLVITGTQDLLTPLGDAEELARADPRRRSCASCAAPRTPHGRGAERLQRGGARLPQGSGGSDPTRFVTGRRRGVHLVVALLVGALAAWAVTGCSSSTDGRATSTTTRAPAPSAPRVLVIGDSNLFESGADVDAALAHVGTEPTLLGVPGYGLKDLDAFWSEQVPCAPRSAIPTSSVVGLGTNDALEPADVRAFPDRLDQMMRDAR